LPASGVAVETGAEEVVGEPPPTLLLVPVPPPPPLPLDPGLKIILSQVSYIQTKVAYRHWE
jgi:hypothetical protein